MVLSASKLPATHKLCSEQSCRRVHNYDGKSSVAHHASSCLDEVILHGFVHSSGRVLLVSCLKGLQIGLDYPGETKVMPRQLMHLSLARVGLRIGHIVQDAVRIKAKPAAATKDWHCARIKCCILIHVQIQPSVGL